MLDGLTVVRFLAAFWVFPFHFDLRIPIELSTPVDRVISNGALAMPVFFMLSGFVLFHNYSGRYDSFNKFLRARVARIYPAYLLSVLEHNLETAQTPPALVVFVLMLASNLALAAISHRWIEPWGSRFVLRHWRA